MKWLESNYEEDLHNTYPLIPIGKIIFDSASGEKPATTPTKTNSKRSNVRSCKSFEVAV